jgi:hypothetical protein
VELKSCYCLGGIAIPQVESSEQIAKVAGLALLFAAGKRPAVEAIVRLAEAPPEAPGFGIAHQPHANEGWIELLSLGLSFDCLGLAPVEPVSLPPQLQLFGLDPKIAARRLEAIELAPGPHLAGGERLMPLVRGLVGLGTQLAALEGVEAVCWRPAGSWMESGYFRRVAGEWLRGGAFPALGLTTLSRGEDGAMKSRGLAFLTGQEILLTPKPNASAADAARLAVRLIDELVYAGPLREQAQYSGPQGEDLIAEPDESGELVRVQWVA